MKQQIDNHKPIAKFYETGLSEYFVEACFIDRKTNIPIKLAEHQIEWHKFVRDSLDKAKKNILILAPRGHGKSLNILGLLLYFLFKDQNHTIKIVSASEQIAQGRLELIKSIIDNNVKFKTLTQGKVIADEKRGFSNDKLFIKRSADLIDPSVQAFGITANLTGTRASILMLDDVVTDQNSSTDEQRKKLHKHLDTVVFPILEADGICITIGTVYHLEDWYETIMNNSEWTVLVQSINEDLTGIEQVIW